MRLTKAANANLTIVIALFTPLPCETWASPATTMVTTRQDAFRGIAQIGVRELLGVP
jgi:hypothetical protein